MSFRFNLLLSAFVLTGCIRSCSPPTRGDMSPKDVVKSYLEAAFNLESVEQKKILLDYVTGGLKDSLQQASDEVIKSLYLNPQYKLENLFIEDPVYQTPSECEVRFNLGYQERFKPKGEEAADAGLITVKVENSVSLLKVDGVWYLQGVIDKSAKLSFPLLNPGDST